MDKRARGGREAEPGGTIEDRLSGATIVFRKTAADTAGELLQIEVAAKPRWSAGPLHVHPCQEERVHVFTGRLRSRVRDAARDHGPDDFVSIPAATPHTLENAGQDDVRLLVEFRPAFRTEELFHTFLGIGPARTTTAPARDLLRVLVATRGYRDEIRIAWRSLAPSWVWDGLVAGAAGAIPSGVPSTVHALATRRDPLESSLAAGSLVLPREQQAGRLLLAAVPVHLALSVGWALALAAVLPRRRTTVSGVAAGLAIAALDLGVIGRRFRRIRKLPVLPQLADHVAYGVAVGAVLARLRARRP